MVRSFQNTQQSWWVPVGRISSQAEALSQAQLFEARHPGLKYTGSWNSAPNSKLFSIEVASAGSIIVSLGATSSRRDAQDKAEAFIAKHLYLKWTASCSELGWLQNFQIVVEAFLPTEWHMKEGTVGACLPVTTSLRLRNLTSEKVTRISARGLEPNDWGQRRPCLQFSDRQIVERGVLEKELDVNFWSHTAKLAVWLGFQSGRYLQFQVNSRVAIDSSAKNHWKFSSGAGLSVYHKVEPGARLLEVVVCDS